MTNGAFRSVEEELYRLEGLDHLGAGAAVEVVDEHDDTLDTTSRVSNAIEVFIEGLFHRLSDLFRFLSKAIDEAADVRRQCNGRFSDELREL